MAEKAYPIIVQTWLSGRGSVLLHGPGADSMALKWSKKQVLRWNEQRRPQPGEVRWNQADYGGYRLIGMLQHGGVEDFGRPFTEIRAVLVDEKAATIEYSELEAKLKALVISQDREADHYQVVLPLVPPPPIPASTSPDQPIAPPSDVSAWPGLVKWVIALAVVVVSAVVYLGELAWTDINSADKQSKTAHHLDSTSKSPNQPQNKAAQGQSEKPLQNLQYKITWKIEGNLQGCPGLKWNWKNHCQVFANLQKVENGSSIAYKPGTVLKISAQHPKLLEKKFRTADGKSVQIPYFMKRNETIRVIFSTTKSFQEFWQEFSTWLKKPLPEPSKNEEIKKICILAEAFSQRAQREEWPRELWQPELENKRKKIDGLKRQVKKKQERPFKNHLAKNEKKEANHELSIKVDPPEAWSELKIDGKNKGIKKTHKLSKGKHCVVIWINSKYKWKENNNYYDGNKFEKDIELPEQNTISLNAKLRDYRVNYYVEWGIDYSILAKKYKKNDLGLPNERCTIVVDGKPLKDKDETRNYECNKLIKLEARIKNRKLEKCKIFQDCNELEPKLSEQEGHSQYQFKVEGEHNIKVCFDTTKEFKDFEKFVNNWKKWVSYKLQLPDNLVSENDWKKLDELQKQISSAQKLKEVEKWQEDQFKWEDKYEQKFKQAKDQLKKYLENWFKTELDRTSDYYAVINKGRYNTVSESLEKIISDGEKLKKRTKQQWGKKYQDKLNKANTLFQEEKIKFKLAEEIKGNKIEGFFKVDGFKKKAVEWRKMLKDYGKDDLKIRCEWRMLSKGIKSDWKTNAIVSSSPLETLKMEFETNESQQKIFVIAFEISLRQLLEQSFKIKNKFQWTSVTSNPKLKGNWSPPCHFESIFPYSKIKFNDDITYITIDRIDLKVEQSSQANQFDDFYNQVFQNRLSQANQK